MSEKSLKDAAVEFLRLVASGEVKEAFRRYVDRGFRHHNPYFRGDRESLIKAMEENAVESPEKVLEVHRVFQDEGFVVVYSRIRQRPAEPGAAVIHIFRFRENLIAEMWDIGQAVPAESPNEFGMF